MAPTPQDPICSPPFQFFQCQNNGFNGCCTIDPCAQSWCPNFAEPNQAYQNANAVSPQSITIPIPTSPTQTSAVLTISQSEAATNKGLLSTSSNSNVVTVYATSEVYVTSQQTSPALQSIIIYPTIMDLSMSTIQTVSVSTQTKTRYQLPTATVTMPALPKQSLDFKSKPQPVRSYASRHKREILSGTFGGIAGIMLGIGMIWCFLQWNRKRKIQNLRAEQFDDHPALAGRDANRAGELLANDQSETSTTEDSPSPPNKPPGELARWMAVKFTRMPKRPITRIPKSDPSMPSLTQTRSSIPKPTSPQQTTRVHRRQPQSRPGNVQERWRNPEIPKMWVIGNSERPKGNIPQSAEPDAIKPSRNTAPALAGPRGENRNNYVDCLSTIDEGEREGSEEPEQNAESSRTAELRGNG
ncbi:uncharacterized protein KY384_004057 [Bacidia gigantensis]|uniref:uncharacterized protein n=1 Tax=Bacidia gigantensis TaxID=2732470 RepID=UPI001D057163|nr:uncharacterized protein KY384_004057 [Bacidia gigantensis]KAG8530701.1 hypothetical protein KY384_004057 [Bacidia gigantensis]